jgi:hypothetical protein
LEDDGMKMVGGEWDEDGWRRMGVKMVGRCWDEDGWRRRR